MCVAERRSSASSFDRDNNQCVGTGRSVARIGAYTYIHSNLLMCSACNFVNALCCELCPSGLNIARL